MTILLKNNTTTQTLLNRLVKCQGIPVVAFGLTQKNTWQVKADGDIYIPMDYISEADLEESIISHNKFIKRENFYIFRGKKSTHSYLLNLDIENWKKLQTLSKQSNKSIRDIINDLVRRM